MDWAGMRLLGGGSWGGAVPRVPSDGHGRGNGSDAGCGRGVGCPKGWSSGGVRGGRLLGVVFDGDVVVACRDFVAVVGEAHVDVGLAGGGGGGEQGVEGVCVDGPVQAGA